MTRGGTEDKKFVGRERELKEFDAFVRGERKNYDGRGTGAPVLLVVGDEGIGKTALLQAMVQRATLQSHYVVLGEVDERQKEFSEQILPLIALLNSNKRFQMGEGTYLLKAGLAALSLADPLIARHGNRDVHKKVTKSIKP